MRARVFIDSPEHVLHAGRVLLSVFAREPRPPVMYGRALRRACRLLKVMAEMEPEGTRWVLSKEWRARLRQAGLDEEMRVVNQKRWDNAWAQLVETGTFRDDVAQRDIATGKRSPKAAPRVKAIALPKRKELETFDTWCSEQIRSRLTRK